jgi:signal transduction histidine kinase/ligand-binding sensor domain-containing protein/CheY-like chemotaxis protein/AraC-like DNA-binding protein
MNFKKSAYFFLLLFLLLITSAAFPQDRDYFFRHLTTDDGLSHNSIYTILEDEIGFLWVGTRSGLNRYDGNSFRTYDLSNSVLKDAYINTLFKDSKSRLWLGTQEGGAYIYQYETDDFLTFTNIPSDSNSISADNVWAFAEDSKGTIWLGTQGGGLNTFREESRSFERIRFSNQLEQGLDANRIRNIIIESDTLFWLGTLDGLFRFNPVSRIISPVIFKGGFIDARIQKMFDDGNGVLWLGTDRGLKLYKKSGESMEDINAENSGLTNDMIQDIVRSPEGEILIATDGGGLNIYNPVSKKIISQSSDPNNPNSLSNNSVYKIYYDQYQGLWIGNYAGGLNYSSRIDWKFKPVRHRLNDENSLSDNHVRSFMQDRNGNIWIGTLGGLNQYDPVSGKFKSYIVNKEDAGSLSSNTVLCIYEDNDGLLWLGTYGGGISILDKKRNTFRKFSHPDDKNSSLLKASIYSIVDLPDNKMCFTTLGGIYIFDKTANKLRRYTSTNSTLSNNTVKSACLDRNGKLWLGTNRGLNRLDPETEAIRVFMHSAEDSSSLIHNRVLSIFEAQDGKIWIGTEGGGISILDPGTEKFRPLISRESMPYNVVYAILQDNTGIFWFSSNKGLISFDVKEKRFRTYSVADGLQGNEFHQNSALRSRDGKLYFGGIDGFNAFYPGDLIVNYNPPKLILSDLYISNRLVSLKDKDSPLNRQLFLTGKIILPDKKSNFSIHFTGLGSINKGKYLYSWKLKGFDPVWTEFADIRQANYSNLRAGEYTFLVRAINSDGIMTQVPVSIAIKILPPWWKTWWAFLIYAISLISFFILFMRYNTAWVQVKHELILERKGKEQIEELNQMKLRFFTNISHEFKTPLTLIMGHLDNLLSNTTENKTETLNNIGKNAKRLLILINQLLEFRKAESGLMKLKASKGNLGQFLRGIGESFEELARSKGISFEFSLNEENIEVWFDAEKMEKILFNLLSNAFKCTPEGGSIRLIYQVSNTKHNADSGDNLPFAEIIVSDNGIGIPEEDRNRIFEGFFQSNHKDIAKAKGESSGIGLAFSKRLVELHHGSINVTSELGRGAEFIVRIPLGKDHLSNEEIKDDASYQFKIDYSTLTEKGSPITQSPEITWSLDDKKPVMLVVDDNLDVSQIIADKFRNKFTVLTGSDGREGLELALRYLPDIIISDIMMPVMDGLEFCTKLKENVITSHIPVILLTAKSGEDSQITGLITGADAYISKPYNPELLQVTVENLLQSRKILRSKFAGKVDFFPAEVTNNKLDEDFLQKVISKIEKESDIESVDVIGLCREVGMSRSALYRKLKALTGNSIQDFVRMVELRKAARMLLETQLSISEVAYQCGFTNAKHFSTSFRKQFGKTPSEFRTEKK